MFSFAISGEGTDDGGDEADEEGDDVDWSLIFALLGRDGGGEL